MQTGRNSTRRHRLLAQSPGPDAPSASRFAQAAGTIRDGANPGDFPSFPRFTEDAAYLFCTLRPFLPPEIDEATATAKRMPWLGPHKIRAFMVDDAFWKPDGH
jgi:hypothetical protein